MIGLFIALLGAGIGYYFYSQKLTKETTSPELQSTGEIRYPTSMILPTKKTEVAYNSATNQIRIQPKPIQKKDITFVPNPITIDINKIIDNATRKLQQQQRQLQQSQSQSQTQAQPTPKAQPESIEEILQKTLNRLEI